MWRTPNEARTGGVRRLDELARAANQIVRTDIWTQHLIGQGERGNVQQMSKEPLILKQEAWIPCWPTQAVWTEESELGLWTTQLRPLNAIDRSNLAHACRISLPRVSVDSSCTPLFKEC